MSSLNINANQWFACDEGADAERALFGELEIVCGETILTRLEDLRARTTRPGPLVCTHHVALWLLSNWWRLRWEPSRSNHDWRLSHDLAGAGGGFAWPSVIFDSDGEFVTVTSFSSPRGGVDPVIYLHSSVDTVSAQEFERAIDAFLETQFSRLEGLGIRSEELHGLHAILGEERSNPKLAEIRRREALLGLDPDQITRSALEARFRIGRWMGSSALDEVLGAASNTDSYKNDVRSLKHMQESASLCGDLSELTPLASGWHEGQTSRDALPAWERASRLAERARGFIGVGINDRVTNGHLHDIYKARVVETGYASRNSRLQAGFRRPGDSDSTVRPVLASRETSKRFAAARLIGDFIDRPEKEAVIPVTTQSTARQKFQRAFAQEFLCPERALTSRVSLPEPTDLELEDAADYFGVSDWTVRNTLVNKGHVSRQYLRYY